LISLREFQKIWLNQLFVEHYVLYFYS